MKYKVFDLKTGEVLHESSDYAAAEEALFKTPEVGAENIIFENAATGERMFSLVCEAELSDLPASQRKNLENALKAMLSGVKRPEVKAVRSKKVSKKGPGRPRKKK